jgi:SAM-dependent methyltransferase
MGQATDPSDFDRFAWVYNRHWGPVACRAYPLLQDLALKALPAGARVLDVCCGTGQLAHLLSDGGYRVTGVDISPEMIRYARENAPDADLMVVDAREMAYPDRFDAAVSTFDSVNHFTETEDLHRLFRSVASALEPDAPFVFDVNTEEEYARWGDSFGIVEDDHACVVRLEYETEEGLARFRATLFHLEDGWQRSDVTIVQRFHPESALRDALSRAGFEEVRAWGLDEESGLSEVTAGSERVYYVCRAGA